MVRMHRVVCVVAFAVPGLTLVGCAGRADRPADTPPARAADPPPGREKPKDEVEAERAKLTPADRAVVDAQELCVVSDERLGSMGPPVKLEIKGRPVFVCCKGCKKEAEADPEKTLARVDELKAKRKGPTPPKPAGANGKPGATGPTK